jgi:hypothetical protein
MDWRMNASAAAICCANMFRHPNQTLRSSGQQARQTTTASEVCAATSLRVGQESGGFQTKSQYKA